MAKKHGDQDGVKRVERNDSGRTDRVKRYQDELFKRPAIKRGGEGAKEGADQYRQGNYLPKFLRAVRKKLDSNWIYQSFKLPGTNYIVRDMRQEEKRAESTFTKEEGLKSQSKEDVKPYVNYLGGRHNLGEGDAKKAEAEIQRLLSEFEKLLIERFEKGREVEKKSTDGENHFREKSYKEWKSFFAKFLKRSIWKKSELKNLRSFIYRGLLNLKKGDGKYNLLIGDLIYSDGTVDKFARIRVLSMLSELMRKMNPGARADFDLIARALESNELRYLALAHKHKDSTFPASREGSKGLFGSLKLEEEIAERLGLRRGRKRYGGPIHWDEGTPGLEKKHAFVPWGYWERQKRRGKKGIISAVLFSVLGVGLLVALWIAIRQLF